MRAKIVTLLIALPLLTVSAQDQHGEGHDATVHHRFDDTERWVELFDSPERDKWQKPSIVVRVIGLLEGDTVADLGAGTGYFTRVLSRGVGARGKVYAVDIEPRMLEHIEQREDLGSAEIVTVVAEPNDPKLPEGELDLVLVVNTWHHIDDRLEYLKKLERTLDSGGRVVVIDFHEGELPVGPPAGSKLSRDAIVAEFAEAKWRLETESVVLPYQYLLVFYPPPGE
jgi:ubiquinone/menaquinone biosynthesis C-methylase UbiE